ncbi:MAG TPA: hypothetical protein DEB24_07770 [Coriobacteriia bacterium]|nr:hypothetical protein [Coriobacteriia bacterium]
MGAGYSSLTYISDFDARCIKIDISLVDEIALDFQKQEIVRSIVGLARQLGLDIIAEGVEQQEQVDALVALGVEYFQGYYFSKPLLSDDFLEYVRSY